MKIRVSDSPNAKTKTYKEIKENTAILKCLLSFSYGLLGSDVMTSRKYQRFGRVFCL